MDNLSDVEMNLLRTHNIGECMVVINRSRIAEQLCGSIATRRAPSSTKREQHLRRTQRRRSARIAAGVIQSVNRQILDGNRRRQVVVRSTRKASRDNIDINISMKVMKRSAWRRGRRTRSYTRRPPEFTDRREITPQDSDDSSAKRMQNYGCSNRNFQIFCRMIQGMVSGNTLNDVMEAKDITVLRTWLDCSEKARFVLMVLIGYKGPWVRAEILQKYSDDVGQLLCELEHKGFVVSELNTQLHCLRVEELTKLGSKLAVSFRSKKKESLVNSLLKKCSSTADKACLHDGLKEVLKDCVRVVGDCQATLERCLLLFSLWHPVPVDGDRVRGARSLVLRQISKLPLSDEDIDFLPKVVTFENQEEWKWWEESARLRARLGGAVEKKDWRSSEKITRCSHERFQHLLERDVAMNSSGWQKVGQELASVLYMGAGALRRCGKLLYAEEIYKILLERPVYLQETVLQCAVDLSTLLQIHLHNSTGAARVLLNASCDPTYDHCAHGRNRHRMSERAHSLLSKLSPSSLSESEYTNLQELVEIPLSNPPKITVKASARSGKPGMKRVYVRRESGRETSFLSVEERVKAYFATRGFPDGVDDEGETLASLAVLALWSEIYDAQVPNAWGSASQCRPLDWGGRSFWTARQQQLEDRLLLIEQSDVDVLVKDLIDAREALLGTTSLVNWRCLRYLDIAGVLRSTTVSVFVAISRRLMQDFYSNRVGFPDLLLWDKETSKCMFVEVKGPKDRLMLSQSYWLHFLTEQGAPVTLAVVNV